MLCNIKPVPFHESDKHIFAKIPGGGSGPPVPPPPSGSAHAVGDPADIGSILQSGIDKVTRWEQRWLVTFNPV